MYFPVKYYWYLSPYIILSTNICCLKGAMCNKVEYLLTEMQYDIHNYVFSGV